MDNNNMNTIKFLKENKIKLNGITYRGYSVCELPNQFGMTEDVVDKDGYRSFKTHQEFPMRYVFNCNEYRSGEYKLIIK